MENEITEVTRRAIMDYLSAGSVWWAGRLQEHEFLARIYDLTKIPSTDSRLLNAASDIRQHRINFNDWTDDWVFFDSRFNLLRSPDEEFLKFLCESVHPVVRPEIKEVREIVDYYNSQLRNDGWEIFEKGVISGRPVFGARKIGGRTYIFDEPTGWEKVDRQIQEVRIRLDTASSEEQFQAVGLLSREVLISLAETVYNPEKHEVKDGVSPSKTDAGRMLESFLEVELTGSGNTESRSYAKATLKLAVALQHKRTANFRRQHYVQKQQHLSLI